MSPVRQQLLDLFLAGVEAVKGRTAVVHALEKDPCSDAVHCIAIGKAAASMLLGAHDVLGVGIQSTLLITKYGHVDEDIAHINHVEILEAAHPLPDENSLVAGQRLVEFIQHTPPDSHLLFLISGGASALVEYPIEGVGLAELKRLNTWLLGSGYDIQQMNQIRKGVSRIKGGRLAQFIGNRHARCLVISDVPGDRLSIIGSGLLIPDDQSQPLPGDLPPWVAAYLASSVASTPNDAPVWRQVRTKLVATLSRAIEAVQEAAQSQQLKVHYHGEFLSGDAGKAGTNVGETLLSAPTGLHVWGGETTSSLPENPGRGGRNQHFALALASEIAGTQGISVLCAGTDGTDGPTNDAGGLVDGGTLERGTSCGLSWQDSLAQFDSGRFLEATGDLVTTGPTGTNVMDLVLALKNEPSA
ncbi:MAG: DUF4147 domain-containing protein [Gammaproteobacteria bacterium]|nr:DUF4147 domain-containing protein [Gammaproteobacteria bacterium]